MNNDEGVKLSIPFRRKFIISENSKLKANEVTNSAKKWHEYSCLCFTLELLHNNKETIILVYSLCTLHDHAIKSQLLISSPGTEQKKFKSLLYNSR
jgi:hypothetical protein